MSVVKARRQRLILSLVESVQVRTHQDLAAQLSKRGIGVSQGTLSRDLRELGIVKTADGYAAPNRIDHPSRAQQRLSQAASQFLVRLDTARNLVVLRTNPGGASALAQFLDAVQWPEIVGTIAGDDTIFAATKDAPTALRVQEMLEAL